MAEETDAARQRVLATRADLATELDRLEASARAAVDIPARVRRSPAKAAAIVGGAGFVALGGPKRLFKRAKAAIVGPEPELPERLLPDEIEKALRKLGDNGEKVRGAIERDFADYVEEARKKRGPAIQGILTGALARPLLTRGAKAAAEWFARTDETGFQAHLERIRTRSATGEPTAGPTAARPPRPAADRADTRPTDR